MTPWPFAYTTAAVVHGAVYLLGSAAATARHGGRAADI